MKKLQSVGLVSAGKLVNSPVTRFWGLSDQLGPVRAPSIRLASRVVNTLRAGYAVENYDEFARCSLILVSVPDEAVPNTVSELTAAPISWHNKAVVLCSTWLDGSALNPISLLGASVGSITPVPGFEDRKYLVEGGRLVAREVQRLLKHRGAQILTIEPPLKPFFLAALNCTGSLFYSLLIAASECLRQTSIPQAEAAAIMQRQIDKTLRSYFVAGKKAFPDTPELSRQQEALAVVQPAVAEYITATAKAATNLISAICRTPVPGSSSTP